MEEEALEVFEAGEVRYGSGEGVVVQTENAELVEVGERAGSEDAAEIQVLDDEADRSVSGALDPFPLAETAEAGGGVGEVEAAVDIGFRFECEEGECI